jgi:hypothetical protein
VELKTLLSILSIVLSLLGNFTGPRKCQVVLENVYLGFKVPWRYAYAWIRGTLAWITLLGF